MALSGSPAGRRAAQGSGEAQDAGADGHRAARPRAATSAAARTCSAMSPMRLPVSRTRPSASGSPSSCSTPRAWRWSTCSRTAVGRWRRCASAPRPRDRAGRALGARCRASRDELDTLAQVISANLTRAALEAAPVIADLSSWLADVRWHASTLGRPFDGPRRRASTCCARAGSGQLDDRAAGRTDRGAARISDAGLHDLSRHRADQRAGAKLDELRRALDQTQALIAFSRGHRYQGPRQSTAPDDTAGVEDRAQNLERIARSSKAHCSSPSPRGQHRDIASTSAGSRTRGRCGQGRVATPSRSTS